MIKGKAIRWFSLLELMVTLVIMAVVMAISAPRLVKFLENEKLNGTASQLAAFINYAREIALIKRCSCRIEKSEDGKSLHLMLQKDPVNNPDEYAPLEDGHDIWTLPDGITLKNQENANIQPGVTTNVATYILSNQKQESITVVVKSGSGRAVLVNE